MTKREIMYHRNKLLLKIEKRICGYSKNTKFQKNLEISNNIITKAKELCLEISKIFL